MHNDTAEKAAESEEKKPRQEHGSSRLERGRDESREQREGGNGDEHTDVAVQGRDEGAQHVVQQGALRQVRGLNMRAATTTKT